MKYNDERLTAKQVIEKIHNYDDKDFILSVDRDKNYETLIQYNLSNDDIINFIKQLTISNNPKSIINKDNRYKTNYLYEFKKCPLFSLESIDGDTKLVKMYFKIGFHHNKCRIYAVSFHEDDLNR